jgi:hypothetical protein
VVPLVHAKAAPDLERIAKAIGGQQTNPGALALQHAIRRHGRTVHEEHAITEHISDAAAEV